MPPVDGDFSVNNPEVAHFVNSPSTRGTLDILWSCLSVLVLCTWTVLHPNVPAQYAAGNRKSFWIRAARRFLHKVVLMLFNLLAPEWTFGKALVDYQSVRQLEELKALAIADGVEWSDAHTYFANMGGFGIKFTTDHPHEQCRISKELRKGSSDFSGFSSAKTSNSNWSATSRKISHTEIIRKEAWEINVNSKLQLQFFKRLVTIADRSVTHSLDVGHGEWQVDKNHTDMISQALAHISVDWLPSWNGAHLEAEVLIPNLMALKGNLWILNGAQLLWARKMGILETLPRISKDDLNDRNKGELIVKVLVVFQVCWFMFELLVRYSNGLPSSQLEVMTFAFTLTSVFSYTLVLQKPKDVTFTVIVDAVRHPSNSGEIVKIAAVGPYHVLTSLMPRHLWISDATFPCLSKDHREILIFQIGSLLVLAIFGTIHCLAWNADFPSAFEQTSWKAASVITAVAMPIWWAFQNVAFHLFNDKQMFSGVTDVRRQLKNRSIWRITCFCIEWLLHISSAAVGLTFGAARLFMLVEVFRSLAFLPEGAFTSTKLSAFPHIG